MRRTRKDGDIIDCFYQIWWFDDLNVYFHGSLPAAALQSRPNRCPFNGQLKGWRSQRASWAWCSHSRTRAERDQRSQVPLFHNPKTNAAPTAWCFESGNPSTDLAGHCQKTGPPFDSVKLGHLQHAQQPLTTGLFLIDIHGICEIKLGINAALATLFTGFLEKGKGGCNIHSCRWDGLLIFCCKIKICLNSNGPSLGNFWKPLTVCKWYSQLSLHPCFGPAERRLAVSRT